MVDELGRLTASGIAVRHLVADTGITDAQATELVGLLGAQNWSSLLREARILKPHLDPRKVGEP